MVLSVIRDVLLLVATFPLIYYLLVLYSSLRFFRHATENVEPSAAFTPPVSILKPIRGLDPDAYENFASFCRLDYPEYEILFCVGRADDPALPAIARLQRDFPTHQIRVIFHDGTVVPNDKVSKLAKLTEEARHEVLVISDSDVRVRPDYLSRIVAPLANARVGAVTCFYVSTGEQSFTDRLQTVGMISDFYPGILVAKQLDGVKFALGPTIATRKQRLADFGGYAALQDRPADDLLVGRLIAEQGYVVELLSYKIHTVADYRSFGDLWAKRLRWLVVMRYMRPWGHLGLIFTQGLPWCLVALAIRPSASTALAYFGAYIALRFAMTLGIGVLGLGESGVFQKMQLIPLWDAMAFSLWFASFFRSRIRWRDGEYAIRSGKLVPLAPQLPAGSRGEPVRTP